MKLREGFVTHTIQNTQMMVTTGEAANIFHGLVRSNETAAFIVDCLKTETTPEEIVQKLLGEYDVSEEVAQQDVQRILDQLNGIGALV